MLISLEVPDTPQIVQWLGSLWIWPSGGISRHIPLKTVYPSGCAGASPVWAIVSKPNWKGRK